MFKVASDLAAYILLKIAEVPPEIKPIIDKVAEKYRQYGVTPPSAAELKAMFPDGWQATHKTNSAQEVLLGSKWMLNANNVKAGFGTPRGYTREPSPGYKPRGRPAPQGSWNSDAFKDNFKHTWDDFIKRRTVSINKPLRAAGAAVVATPLAYGAVKAYQDWRKNQDADPGEMPDSRVSAKKLKDYMVLAQATEAKPLANAFGLAGAGIGSLAPSVISGKWLKGGLPRTVLNGLFGAFIGSSAGGAIGYDLNEETAKGKLYDVLRDLEAKTPEGKRITQDKVFRAYRSAS